MKGLQNTYSTYFKVLETKSERGHGRNFTARTRTHVAGSLSYAQATRLHKKVQTPLGIHF